jgi:hypothetical protein
MTSLGQIKRDCEQHLKGSGLDTDTLAQAVYRILTAEDPDEMVGVIRTSVNTPQEQELVDHILRLVDYYRK